MGSDLVVLSELCVDDDLGLLGCMEPFGVEGFATQRAVDAFVVVVLGGGSTTMTPLREELLGRCSTGPSVGPSRSQKFGFQT